ncbi:cell wall-active antibiotic response 4TMS protein YvqF [Halopolyspora algeriensis]|uniref:Cell wall-active antibiotic response 4TMS protein YvqF n=1 Tax=Halopolyspora algeriensis TaxID=1500506 RepID=A0A368VGP8_9ACTN|nr:DUF1707 domain-containing protein [Halopolyspora algeriensis]RCW40498.1 cell wall-active antibiotic response 4TMS protein YvqF [Halopolyspora algeriensis]TQM53781.1 cell wall-active antibiotic response 4TMS protein YvqF [Halopolyspora algeriensis]
MSASGGSDDPSIRASDAERERVNHQLNEAVGEGRLTLDEFTQRLNQVYESSTRGELQRITADLPASDSGSAALPAETGGDTGKRRWTLAILGGSDYKGRRRVPPRIGFFAFMGGSTIDLCEAQLPGDAVEITLVSIMGGTDVIVPKGIRVELDSTDFLGGDDLKIDESAEVANSPVVRIRSYSLLGGSNICHPKKRKPRWWQ